MNNFEIFHISWQEWAVLAVTLIVACLLFVTMAGPGNSSKTMNAGSAQALSSNE